MAIFHGIEAVSVYEPNSGASSGGLSPSSDGDATVVQMDDIVAQTFEFIERTVENDQTDPTGGRYFGGDVHECRFQFIDTSGTAYSQLDTWMQNDTRVSLVAVGVSKSVQWYERDTITVNPIDIEGEAQGRADVFEVEIIRRGHGAHSIWGNVNLLAGPVGWADSDGNNVPDNYTSTFNSDSFSDPTYTGTTGASGTEELSVDLEWPISGYDLTLSTNITSLHADTDQPRIRELNSSGSVLEDNTTNLSSTGRYDLGATTNSNIHYLTIEPIRVTSLSGSDTQAGQNPSLRLDGSTNYVTH